MDISQKINFSIIFVSDLNYAWRRLGNYLTIEKMAGD